jgi:hypothetical protein
MQRGIFSRAGNRLPDVVGIGCEKCGTTSLHYYLKAHPEVGVPRLKETRFFTANWHRGVEWYKRQFPLGARALVESHGGGYTNFPREQGVPERIHSLLPGVQMTLLVRNPVDRLVSQWVHNYSNSTEDRPFEEAVAELDGNPYVVPTLHFYQLEQYLKLFRPEQFHVFTSEELKTDRRGQMRKIFRLLGVDESFDSSEFDVIRHPSATKRRNTPLGMAVERLFGNPAFWNIDGWQRYWFKKFFYTPVSRRIERPQPSPELRRRLNRYFEPDVRRLEEFAGRKFEGWLT